MAREVGIEPSGTDVGASLDKGRPSCESSSVRLKSVIGISDMKANPSQGIRGASRAGV